MARNVDEAMVEVVHRIQAITAHVSDRGKDTSTEVQWYERIGEELTDRTAART